MTNFEFLKQNAEYSLFSAAAVEQGVHSLRVIAAVLYLLIQGQILEDVRIINEVLKQLVHVFTCHGGKINIHRGFT